MKKCPYCSVEIGSEWRYCKACGKKLKTAALGFYIKVIAILIAAPLVLGIILNIAMAINVNSKAEKMRKSLKVGGLISELMPQTSPFIFITFRKSDKSKQCLQLIPRPDKCFVSIYGKEGGIEKIKDSKEIADFQYNKFITDNWDLVQECDEVRVVSMQMFFSSDFSAFYLPDGKIKSITKKSLRGS